MALSNFTLVRNPFNNALLDNAPNTYFIDADTGDDTNSGTRALPFKSLNAITPTNNVVKTYVLRGKFEGSLTLNVTSAMNPTLYFLGDLNTEIRGSVNFVHAQVNATGSSVLNFYNLNMNLFTISVSNFIANAPQQDFIFRDCKINTASYSTNQASATHFICKNTVFNNFNGAASVLRGGISQVTIDRLTARADVNTTVLDSIISGVIDFGVATTTGTGYTLNNCIIRKQVEWRWNGQFIAKDLATIGEVKAAVDDFADDNTTTTQRDNLKAHVDKFFGTGTMIYDDSGQQIRIFNRYDTSGNVLDYSLNRQNGNPALFNSAFMSYVGAMRPKVEAEFNNAVDISVNDTGTNPGTLLVKDMYNNIFIDLTSSQTRNKMETATVMGMLPGDAFTKWQSSFFPSNSPNIYLGPKQNLAGGLHPINGVLVTPYDTSTSPSPSASYPPFLAPLNAEVQVAYFIIGGALGNPVTFNDLAGLGITPNKILTEVGTWAVSNACHEWSELIQRTDIAGSNPRFRYFKLTLFANIIV